ncbi:MAG: DUF3333 domain-containing protein, partial [Alphaproteobacteria bacterium]|nr:DUF3333 domain-containing protein [Alphaproteobacteria bacterium]
MTDSALNPNAPGSAATAQRVKASLAKRYAAEKRFRAYGLVSIILAILFLGTLLTSIVGKGYTAFLQTEIRLDVDFDKETIDPTGKADRAALARADYESLVKASLRREFPDVKGRRDKRKLYGIVSGSAAYDLQRMVLKDPSIIGTTRTVWLPASDDVDVFVKGHVDASVPEDQRRIKDKEVAWIDALKAQGAVEKVFNTRFFTSGDSRDPEVAGIWGAVVGSFFTLMVTLVLAFPLGVMAAVYLEEFAPKPRWTDRVEVNLNNLAAVPSIVFGLLGLAVFLNFFHLPRSAPLVGGMVLALMTLPTIIIASRAALKAVPASMREAALGIGASRVQTVTDHVLP